jgi:hypothetical protein
MPLAVKAAARSGVNSAAMWAVWSEIDGDAGGAGDSSFVGGVAAGAGLELNVDTQPGVVAVGVTLSVGVVGAHAGFVDSPAQAGIGAFGTEGNIVGSGLTVNGGGEEEFSVCDFSDLPNFAHSSNLV